jgi:hypothetical protein
MIQNLYKFWAYIKDEFITYPKGIWVPPPYFCTIRDSKTNQYYHDPFLCQGKCHFGWKCGKIKY